MGVCQPVELVVERVREGTPITACLHLTMDEICEGSVESSASELWSEQARARLTGALSSAVDRAQGQGRDGKVDEQGERFEEELDDDVHDLGLNGNLSDELDTPLKRIISGEAFTSVEKSPRHRRRRKTAVNRSRELHQHKLGTAQEQSGSHINKKFVMKLFDRSLDLAQFQSDATLFPLCRAWIKNRPNCSSTSTSHSNEETYNKSRSKGASMPTGLGVGEVNPAKEGEESSSSAVDRTSEKLVAEMPPCRPLDLDSSGVEVRLRIPEPTSYVDDAANSIDKVKSFALHEVTREKVDLLALNMSRWQKVRADWRDSAKRNEERFEQSFALLEDLYEK